MCVPKHLFSLEIYRNDCRQIENKILHDWNKKLTWYSQYTSRFGNSVFISTSQHNTLKETRDKYGGNNNERDRIDTDFNNGNGCTNMECIKNVDESLDSNDVYFGGIEHSSIENSMIETTSQTSVLSINYGDKQCSGNNCNIDADNLIPLNSIVNPISFYSSSPKSYDQISLETSENLSVFHPLSTSPISSSQTNLKSILDPSPLYPSPSPLVSSNQTELKTIADSTSPLCPSPLMTSNQTQLKNIINPSSSSSSSSLLRSSSLTKLKTVVDSSSIHRSSSSQISYNQTMLKIIADSLSSCPSIPSPQSSQDINIDPKIINISNTQLSNYQIKILSKGLKFTPTPKSNLTSLKTDIQEFSRKIRLSEYFYNDDNDDTEIYPITTDELDLVRNKSNFDPKPAKTETVNSVCNSLATLPLDKTPNIRKNKNER